MKNSPPKIVVARLTAGKLYCFLHRGGAAAKRTSGGQGAKEQEDEEGEEGDKGTYT